jgi:hypothetical protein
MMKRQFSACYSEPSAGGVAISSRTGDAYSIWQFGSHYECECAQYRALGKHCKHIGLLKAAIRTNKAGELRNFFNYNKKEE